MKSALIFNIQKFSVHDGPGIRTTVFFKGCPLSCQWCHNPESQPCGQEILLFSNRCTSCGLCAQNCPQQAIEVIEGQVVYHASDCIDCGACAENCYNNAREVVGKVYTVSQLMREIVKDRPFYEQSGGGVTLSGGEVMMHIEFVLDLVKACKEQGISVAIDTCGYAPLENFKRILEYVDVFLYDIKLMNAQQHKHYTGMDNTLILDNLTMLSGWGANISLRLPLIKGINDDDAQIDQVLDFILGLKIGFIHLLPYHDMAVGKYEQWNIKCPTEKLFPPTPERLDEISNIFKQAHYKVKIGG